MGTFDQSVFVLDRGGYLALVRQAFVAAKRILSGTEGDINSLEPLIELIDEMRFLTPIPTRRTSTKKVRLTSQKKSRYKVWKSITSCVLQLPDGEEITDGMINDAGTILAELMVKHLAGTFARGWLNELDKQLQELLGGAGISPVSVQFGKKTEAAISRVDKRFGEVVDAVVFRLSVDTDRAYR